MQTQLTALVTPLFDRSEMSAVKRTLYRAPSAANYMPAGSSNST